MSESGFKSGYDSKSVSNLVLNVDSRQRGEIGPSSDVLSLAGRKNVREMMQEMGSRAQVARTEADRRGGKQAQRGGDSEDQAAAKRRRGGSEAAADLFSSAAASSALSSSSLYRPQTRETRLAYDGLLSFLSSSLPSLSAHDVLTSCADELLIILKDDSLTAKKQQAEAEALLGTRLPDDKFRQLLNIARRITDWSSSNSGRAGDDEQEREGGGGAAADGKAAGGRRKEEDGEVDDRVGVSVLFNEDGEEEEEGRRGEDDDGGDELLDVIKDEESEEEEDADDAEAAGRMQDDDAATAQATLQSKDAGPKPSDGAADDGVTADDDDTIVLKPSAASSAPSTAAAQSKGSGALDLRTVDAHWLQRQIAAFTPDALSSQSLSSAVFSHLSDSSLADGAVETLLVGLLGFERFALIKRLLRNRWRLVFAIRWARAGGEEEKAELEREMRDSERAKGVWEELTGSQQTAAGAVAASASQAMELDSGAAASASPSSAASRRRTEAYWVKHPKTLLDLSALAFADGSHHMSNADCRLPKGSEIFSKKNYQEVHIPALTPLPPSAEDRLVRVDSMPAWAQPAFAGMTELNRIQSRVYSTAMDSVDNMLVCAPTSSGKTNVAMLCLLREIGQYRGSDGVLAVDRFKAVYIAPMKSLVQEMVLNFGRRLASYGIKVAELSGDSQLSREQLQSTQLIVTTPEKYDIVTRKAGDRSYTQLVRLLIIDEIHLLHDDRGPVLEAIVARTIRQVEREQELVRLVGLSATLPNYEDVALFLRVNPSRGLFFFDNSYRPVPLHQLYAGVTVKKPFKRMQLMNEICYDKVMQAAGRHQLLVFVHSRKDTAITARMLRDRAQEADELVKFIRDDEEGRREILRVEAENVGSEHLKSLLPHGFGIHHAGMTRKDRTLVEELFADGHVKVLVCTATLAWGVNLPAHTVIIKGTKVYSPEKGDWQELSHLDVMQMLGRAGRPQYDAAGEGVIITSHGELQYYLSLLNQQLPVESQFIAALPDQLNAEVVAGSVTSLKEAVEWLGYTFLYVRMLRRPQLYGIGLEALSGDPYLEQRRLDLVHTAASLLDRHQLIRYDRKSGALSSTELGRVASHYYLSHASVAVYSEHLKPSMSDIELFRLFSLSAEFRQLGVRQEEKVELARLLDKVPIPVKESLDERSAKVNVLLQAYISRLTLEGFALMSDLVYITQSAGRITRALFEIVLRRGWSSVAVRLLTLAKMVEHRCWEAQSPLRQFPSLPVEQVKKIEGKDLSLPQLLDLDAPALGELLRNAKAGVSVYKLVHHLPHLELAGQVQPVTRTLLRIQLSLTADFAWSERLHGRAEAFWVLVEDVDGEQLLHYEFFLLRAAFASHSHSLQFSVPIFDPLPPQYFIRVVSDRWLGCDITLPVSFRRLLLPDKFAPPTELLDLQPLLPEALGRAEYEQFMLARGVRRFNPVQTQLFHAVYGKQDNLMLAAPTCGKTVVAELAVLRMLSQHADGRCAYVTPLSALAEERERDWRERFRALGVKVVRLTGDVSVDSRLLAEGRLIVSSARDWEAITRRWKNRAVLKEELHLCIFDDLHLIAAEKGELLEVAVSRMRFIQTQLEHRRLRLLGLSAAVANARELGEWLGCPAASIFNFHPNVRPLPLEIRIHGLDIVDQAARQQAMLRPCWRYIQQLSAGKPVLLFTTSQKQTKQVALSLTTAVAASDDSGQLVRGSKQALQSALEEGGLTSGALHTCLLHGVGYLLLGMEAAHRSLVLRLYAAGIIRCVVLDASLCYGLNSQLSAYLVLIMGTQQYDHQLHSYADLPLATLLQMTSYAFRPAVDSAAQLVLFTSSNRKELYKRSLYSAFSVESVLQHALPAVLIHEIISRRVETVQEAIDYLTWSFLYRRLTLNPNWYGLTGSSHRHVSDFLSELVENAVDDLKDAQMISADSEGEDDAGGGVALSVLNLGMIASFYSLHYTTVEIFNRSLKASSRLKAILDIVSSASEFDALIVVREKEAALLESMARHLPLPVSSADFTDCHVKVGVLLQCHLNRAVPLRFVSDVSSVLELLPRLLMAMVDVLSSNGWLLPALAVMELSQMLVQAMWNRDSPLRQIPHLSEEVMQACRQRGITGVADILDMDDADRQQLLGSLTPQQLQDVARVCNAYPDVDLDCRAETEAGGRAGKEEVLRCRQGDTVSVVVTLRRDTEEEEEGGVPVVQSAYFPHVKSEGWWLVVGSADRNELVGIKRVVMARRELETRVECSASASGRVDWTVFLMSDCWMGCDQEARVRLQVEENAAMEQDGLEQKEDNSGH